MTGSPASARNFRGQTLLGLGLAALVIASWTACHVFAVFYHVWTPLGSLTAPLLVAVQCWLSVGLFIVAHDCMHGSLAPFRPRLNLWVGRLCLGLYAGFFYDSLVAKHFAHHRHSGTAEDPDFDEDDPEHPVRWFVTFFCRYFDWRNLVVLAMLVLIYMVVFKAPLANLLVFWALPALVSAYQLFYFGTYLPHRHGADEFADAHKARSNDYSWLVSLLTCFHFGYHHEHHLQPHVPWWRLPRVHAVSAARPDPIASPVLRHSR